MQGVAPLGAALFFVAEVSCRGGQEAQVRDARTVQHSSCRAFSPFRYFPNV
ncbi:hypothetical protein SAMN04487823_106105 [Olsenella sp. kh2p3]|nr:hypothetical protein SAMN04487823_106105 [Olsenella sp. kh2p3]